MHIHPHKETIPMELTNQEKWLIGSTLLSVGSILFVIGWTAPYWPPWGGWLSLPLMKTLFPVLAMSGFVIFFLYGLAILSQTVTPPTQVAELDE